MSDGIVLCKKCIENNEQYLGRNVYIPMKIRIDRDKVIKMRNDRKTVPEIATKEGVSTRLIWKILAEKRKSP